MQVKSDIIQDVINRAKTAVRNFGENAQVELPAELVKNICQNLNAERYRLAKLNKKYSALKQQVKKRGEKMIGKYINQFMADNELLVNEEFFIKNMDGNRVLIGLADRYKIEDIDGGILTAVVMNEKDKPPAMLLESALIDLLRENYFIEKSLFIQLSENVITSSAQPVG